MSLTCDHHGVKDPKSWLNTRLVNWNRTGEILQTLAQGWKDLYGQSYDTLDITIGGKKG